MRLSKDGRVEVANMWCDIDNAVPEVVRALTDASGTAPEEVEVEMDGCEKVKTNLMRDNELSISIDEQ